MAIKVYGGNHGIATANVIPDNTAVALDIESTDAKDWIVADTTNDADELLFLSSFTASDNESAGRLGVRTDDPKAIVHIVGKGGKSDESHLPAITADASPTLVLDNGTGNNSDRCSLVMNSNGSQGSIIDLYQDTDRRFIIQATDTTSEIRSNDCHLELDTNGTAYDLVLKTNDTNRMTIDGGTGACRLAAQTAIQYNSGVGTDTATTEPVYLADTNGTMIIDFNKGNFGDITLAANVTAVKFWNAPADGTTATITAKITQDSSVRTIDYADSAVSVYSDTSTGVTGEIKFAGGAHHVQSTGSGAVDLVSFTCIPAGSTFNIYAAVIGQAFA